MTMLRFGWAVMVAAGAISCASHQPVALRRAPTAMERQIRNAVDAGDGDYQLRILRQRVVAEPENIDVRLELAAAYRDRGLSDLAVEHCRVAVDRFPESAAARLELARGLRGAGMRKDAVEGLQAFLDTHPQENPKYLSWVGIMRDELNQLPAGEAAHRAALALEPGNDSLLNNLGYNLLMQGKHEEAAARFRAALQANPRSEIARNNLGLTLANTDGKDQAVQQWQAGSDPATAHSNLAAYLIEQGRYVEARKELSTALGYNSRHPAALRNLELVSRMDGSPATMPARPQTPGTRAERFKRSVRRLFVGPLNEQPAGAGSAAAN